MKKRRSAEQIMGLLRQADVDLMAKHESVNGPSANPAARPNPVRGECSMNTSSRIRVSKAGYPAKRKDLVDG